MVVVVKPQASQRQWLIDRHFARRADDGREAGRIADPARRDAFDDEPWRPREVPGLAGITVDVLLYPPVNYARMRERAVTFKAGEVPIVVVGIDDLIALKQAVGRPIDLSDIEHLKRLGAL